LCHCRHLKSTPHPLLALDHSRVEGSSAYSITKAMSKWTYVHAKETYIYAKKPCKTEALHALKVSLTRTTKTMSKVIYIYAKETYIYAKETYINAKALHAS